jgi:IS5 family transposase
MKAHIGVDADSSLVHSVVGTAADVNDVTQASELVHGDESDVFSDAGYQGLSKREETQESTFGSRGTQLLKFHLWLLKFRGADTFLFWVVTSRPLKFYDVYYVKLKECVRNKLSGLNLALHHLPLWRPCLLAMRGNTSSPYSVHAGAPTYNSHACLNPFGESQSRR